MSRDQNHQLTELSRREFLAGTGGAVAGAAVVGLAGKSEAGEPKPGRGGTVRFATRSDAIALDPHRNTMYYVSFPIALTTQGLVDLNPKLEPVPGIATEWAASKDLLTYTFNSMLKFFVLDVSLVGGVAVSSGPAPDSAFAPSFLGRPFGQLP